MKAYKWFDKDFKCRGFQVVTIKENTWYTLKNGEIVEVQE